MVLSGTVQYKEIFEYFSIQVFLVRLHSLLQSQQFTDSFAGWGTCSINSSLLVGGRFIVGYVVWNIFVLGLWIPSW